MTSFQNSSIRDIMQTALCTVLATDSLRTALRVMSESGKSCLLITPDSPADGIGILTQKDLISAVFDYAEDLDDTFVSDLMTAPSVTVPPEYSVETAVRMMRNLGVRRVPVLENDKLVGIVSLTDVFQRAAAALLNS